MHKKNILVVGAGDAAIENALALSENNSVYVVNRGGEFARAKEANNTAITKAIENGKIKCLFNAVVSKIDRQSVIVSTPDGDQEIKIDHIIARLGCILPRGFLEQAGIKFANKNPECIPVVDYTYQSEVRGLYVLGALIGYPLISNT